MAADPSPRQARPEEAQDRILVLTACVSILIVFGLAVASHKAMHQKDLRRAGQLETLVREHLAAPPAVRESPDTPGQDGGFLGALTQMPDAAPIDALPLYDEAELTAFARTRWQTGAGTDELPSLAAVLDVRAHYVGGGVALSWIHDPATELLRRGLPDDESLELRVFRTQGLGEPKLVARLPHDALRWRDAELPLARATLSYEVWVVRLRKALDPAAEPLLVDTQRGLPVTVATPEHFTLALVAGDDTSATLAVWLGPEGARVAERRIEARPGDALALQGQALGLTLESLEVAQEARVVTRPRLLFKSDASLVLDPDSNRPRTEDTQHLVSVPVLIATLRDRSGAPRTLELDLP